MRSRDDVRRLLALHLTDVDSHPAYCTHKTFTLSHTLSSSLSSAVPAELVKARMQTQSFATLGHCLRDAVARERGGLFGLYTG